MPEQSQSKLLIPALIISFLAVCLYSNTVFNGFTWDDTYTVEENRFIKDFGNLKHMFTHEYLSTDNDIKQDRDSFSGSGETNYRPIVTLTYMIEHALWKTNPAGYHFSNMLVHGLCTLLLIYMTFLLFNHRTLALVCGILFAVHPLATETVNAISFREDSLCLMFILASLIFYIRARITTGNLSGNAVAASIFGLLACLSKEIGAMLPLLCLATALIVPFQKNLIKKDALLLGSVSSAILLYLFLYFCIFDNQQVNPRYWFWKDTEAWVAALIQVHSKNISLFLYPDICADHYIYKAARLLDGKILFDLAIILATLTYLVFGIYKKWKGIFGLVIVAICILPVSGIFPLRHIIAERYLYIPLAGFSIWASWLLIAATTRFNMKQSSLIAVVTILAASLGSMTFLRNREWVNDDVLSYSTLESNPQSYHANYNIGVVKLKNQEHEDAIPYFEKAALANPYKVDVFIGLGGCYWNSKQYEKSLPYFEKCVRMYDGDYKTQTYLGSNYIKLKEYDKARAHIRKALELKANFIPALHDMGLINKLEHNDKEAKRYWDRALEIDPESTLIKNTIENFKKAQKFEEERQEREQKNKNRLIEYLLSKDEISSNEESFTGRLFFIQHNEDLTNFDLKNSFKNSESFRIAILFINPQTDHNGHIDVELNIKQEDPEGTIIFMKDNIKLTEGLIKKSDKHWYLSNKSPTITVKETDIPGTYTYIADFHDKTSGRHYQLKKSYRVYSK